MACGGARVRAPIVPQACTEGAPRVHRACSERAANVLQTCCTCADSVGLGPSRPAARGATRRKASGAREVGNGGRGFRGGGGGGGGGRRAGPHAGPGRRRRRRGAERRAQRPSGRGGGSAAGTGPQPPGQHRHVPGRDLRRWQPRAAGGGDRRRPRSPDRRRDGEDLRHGRSGDHAADRRSLRPRDGLADRRGGVELRREPGLDRLLRPFDQPPAQPADAIGRRAFGRAADRVRGRRRSDGLRRACHGAARLRRRARACRDRAAAGRER